MTSRYQAYLLRIWQVGKEEDSEWRASLEDPHTHKTASFANLEDLFAFLRVNKSVQNEEEGNIEKRTVSTGKH